MILVWYLGALLIAASPSDAATSGLSEKVSLGIARRLLHASDGLLQKLKSDGKKRQIRKLEDSNEGGMMCDGALSKCMGVGKCLECYAELSSKEVDWASIPRDVSCKEALQYIYEDGHCSYLSLNFEGEQAFCDTFEACVRTKSPKNTTKIDCAKLTTCDFEGMHRQFLGDGICHDSLPGCYNTEICGYDLGDCCEDSCWIQDSSWISPSEEGEEDTDSSCGMEGYACRDPYSADCDKKLTTECGKHEDYVDSDDDFYDDFECEEGKTTYRLVLYDSFGDGWDETTITLAEKGKKTTIFEGALQYGSMGTIFVCLNSSPACYTVVTKGGIWGKEVSWEVKPLREGAPAIASGGAPMDCQFSAGGAPCETTCLGRTGDDPTSDPDYKAFKAMYQCMDDKCPIQMAACKTEESCQTCFKAEDMTPQYCFGIETFNSMVNCALCSCTDESKDDFCMNRDGKRDAPSGQYPFCSPSQVMQGGEALIEFNSCTNFNEFAMLMMEFDNDHFGDLDTFERCAHEYRKKDDHGGYTALGCMKILVDAIDGDSQVEKLDPAMTDAVKSLAGLLYQDAENFCDCAMDANKNCPLCDSFHNFKTLLYEAVDACVSLDEIDCDAWSEFYPVCKTKMTKTFTTVDFNDAKQCEFVHSGCGGAGPFPSFRRLDCQDTDEVAEEAWGFYQMYANGCLNDAVVPQPQPAPQPTPAKPQVPDSGSSPGRKPYVPPEKRDKKPDEEKKQDEEKKDDGKSGSDVEPEPDASKGSVDTPKKKKSHFFRNFFYMIVLGGGGYCYYKRYGLSLEGVQDLINYINRLRRGRGYGQMNYDGAMYSGLAMESSMTSSTSFEPASLPPPPSAVDGNYYI